MESKNVKVIDEHGIDRIASVICSIDVDGSDYAVYRIERDNENDNLFVSKIIKNNDMTANLVNIDDSVEKGKIADIVKELVTHAINANGGITDGTVNLANGKAVKISSVIFNKEQNINVQKTYITTVKKSVTDVSEKYYKVAPVAVPAAPAPEPVAAPVVETAPEPVVEMAQPFLEPTPVAPEETAMPEIEPLPPVQEVVADTAVVLEAPAVETVSTVPEPVMPEIASAPEPVVAPVMEPQMAPPVPEPVMSEPVAAPVVEPVAVAPVMPVTPVTMAPPVMETPAPEPVVAPVPEPVAPVAAAPVMTAAMPQYVTEPVPAAPMAPTQMAPQAAPLVFDGSKESNLTEALSEVGTPNTVPAEGAQALRDFGQDTPIAQMAPQAAPMAPTQMAPAAPGYGRMGYANNKFIMVIAVLFFVASCVFLGYEVFKYIQIIHE